MSEFKGTPGPWRIVDRGIWDISIEADGTVAHVNNKGEWFPSNGGESISGRSHNTMLADARLIAAAPELLEACQALMDATNEDGMTNSMLLGCAIEMAGNALARCRGGAA